MVSREEARQLYSHAAVFCCPSVYEPFGIINLEAAACETPVVASAVGGIPEVVVDGETGLLVPVELRPDDPMSPIDPDRFELNLAGAINALMSDLGDARGDGPRRPSPGGRAIQLGDDRAGNRRSLPVNRRPLVVGSGGLHAGHQGQGVPLAVLEEGHPLLDAGGVVGVDHVRSAGEVDA